MRSLLIITFWYAIGYQEAAQMHAKYNAIVACWDLLLCNLSMTLREAPQVRAEYNTIAASYNIFAHSQSAGSDSDICKIQY